MSSRRVLTGITTSGTPHLGNYAGAIRPAIDASRPAGVESFYFLADYHALIKTADPARVQRSTLEIAASWLAAGLDTDRVWFYRQSDIPEIPELTWLLTCVAGKGLLNRAHAYKAAVDRNLAEGVDPDAGVNMGLFMYPVLMAADILMFKAHSVPVGRDQIQHIEMARDIAARFNHLYGEHFVLPEAAVDESVATLPGLDGRKMSKSYDNTIPLFAPRAELKKLIFSIVTDSREPGEPKDAEGSALFQLYQAFATPQETRAMRAAFEEGIAWGEAKQALFERIDRAIAPMRERYLELIAEPARIEDRLREGALKARAIATPFLAELRHAVGLRGLASATAAQVAERPKAAVLPQFKQYREADGRFYFKFVDGEGRLLLQGAGFDSPRDAGRCVAGLKQGAPFVALGDELAMEGRAVATLAAGATLEEVRAALAALAA
ncbi:tryptophan--tRNA ligase [Thauera phenolivorans]|uniref:tryptophan--tRNA ligase n=1 Tax=Thauera phenolivorans TaxID=1792543 RepID=UPI00083B2836|nr:tryptophan--tRNA ligase [Thauera phenolivorans]